MHVLIMSATFFPFLLIILHVAGIGLLTSQLRQAPTDDNNTDSELPDSHLQSSMRIAICLTGQLLRLEVISKIKNLIAYNSVHLGHKVDVFILLDNDIIEAKQTYWRHDYSNSIYRNMTTKTLRKYFEKNVVKYVAQQRAQLQGNEHQHVIFPIKVRVILSPPVQANYTILRGKVPVGDKTGPSGDGMLTVGDFEPAGVRFQNNMRWMGALRSCVKWVQQTEQQQQWFYDIVIRLRDDSYLLGPWPITVEKYEGAFVTAGISSSFGVNDHNFAIDRRWADTVLRGITEDYYFNETLDMYSWTNTEHRIFKILTSKDIPIRTTDVCEQPITHLRGMINESHWRLHPTYSNHLVLSCRDQEPKPDLKLPVNDKNISQNEFTSSLSSRENSVGGSLHTVSAIPPVSWFSWVDIASWWRGSNSRNSVERIRRNLAVSSKRSEKGDKGSDTGDIGNNKIVDTINNNGGKKVSSVDAIRPCCLPEWMEVLSSGGAKVVS